MIVREVTGLAHAHRVEQSIIVRAVPCVLISAIFTITTAAHILQVKFMNQKVRRSYLRVVLSMSVRAFGDLHHFS